jgi:hypothetical protein
MKLKQVLKVKFYSMTESQNFKLEGLHITRHKQEESSYFSLCHVYV